MSNYNKNPETNIGSCKKYGDRSAVPPASSPENELTSLAEKIRAFFAPPPPDLALAAGILERQTRRREACLALAAHLEQPDGRLKFTGILKLGEIAEALKLSYKHARQALRDLLDIGGFERQKILLFGNNCGHNPDAPRYFTPPEDHKFRPLIIRRTIEKIQAYYINPTILPALNAVNGSSRRQRSERREACVALLSCLLHYTELVTLRVGIPQADGSMKGLTLAYMAELSGLDERRAERAIKDLKGAGIITVHPLCLKLEEALYKGLAAIRVVSKHLFDALGLGDWLRNERQKAADRRKKKDAKREAKQQANVKMAANAQHGPRKASEKSETGDVAGNAARSGEMSSAAAYIAKMRDLLKGGSDPPD